MENRLNRLEQNYAQLDVKLAAVEKAIDSQSAKLDKIMFAITKHEAQPEIDLFKILNFIVQATVLFALVVSGIVYLSANVHSARISVLEYYMINQTVAKGPKSGL